MRGQIERERNDKEGLARQLKDIKEDARRRTD
jgi:hypothetical protein